MAAWVHTTYAGGLKLEGVAAQARRTSAIIISSARDRAQDPLFGKVVRSGQVPEAM